MCFINEGKSISIINDNSSPEMTDCAFHKCIINRIAVHKANMIIELLIRLFPDLCSQEDATSNSKGINV